MERSGCGAPDACASTGEGGTGGNFGVTVTPVTSGNKAGSRGLARPARSAVVTSARPGQSERRMAGWLGRAFNDNHALNPLDPEARLRR